MPFQDVNIKLSWQHSVILLLVLFAGCIVLAVMPWSIWLKAMAMLVFFAYTLRLFYREVALQAPHVIIRIGCDAQGVFRLTTRQGVEYQATLRGDSTVTSVVSILRFTPSNQAAPLSCTLFPDSLPTGEYRRLMKAIKLI